MINNKTGNDQWLSFGITWKRPETITYLWQKFNLIRIKRKIKTRAIFIDQKSYEMWKGSPLMESKILKVSELVSGGIFRNRLVLFNWKDFFAVEIIDKTIANAFRKYFEIMWRNAKRPKIIRKKQKGSSFPYLLISLLVG
ncbi:MAG: hypothetical protein QXK80_01790 [Candidatus Pacearchaeota archaeon]